MEKKHIQVLIWILVPIWVILLFINGTAITLAFFKPLSFITGAAIFFIGVFDKWLWKWKILHPWFVSTPNISGTWQAEINSSWIDKTTGKQSNNIEAYFIIKQTLSNIKVTLLTKESHSELIGGELVKDKNNGKYCITGVYLNEPKLLKVKQSPMHYGALFCKITFSKKSITINGCYWTSRETKGEINFLKRSRCICSGFDECRKIFSIG